jgi:hypothetical protein
MTEARRWDKSMNNLAIWTYIRFFDLSLLEEFRDLGRMIMVWNSGISNWTRSLKERASFKELKREFGVILGWSIWKADVWIRKLHQIESEAVEWNEIRFLEVFPMFAGPIEVREPECSLDEGYELEKEERLVCQVGSEWDYECEDKTWESLVEKIVYTEKIEELLKEIWDKESPIIIHRGRSKRKFERWRRMTNVRGVSNMKLRMLLLNDGVDET